MRREEGTSKRELKAFKTMRVRSQTVVPNTASVFQGWANERAVEVRECTQRKTGGKSKAFENTEFPSYCMDQKINVVRPMKRSGEC